MSYMKSGGHPHGTQPKVPAIVMPGNRLPLVVDQQFNTRRMLVACFRSAGVKEVIEATDGATALMMLNSNVRIGLILCDWHMEPVNGFDFLRVLRQEEDPHLRYMPFVMMSTERTEATVRKAMDAGVDAFVAKPFSMLSLHAGVRRALASERALLHQTKVLGDTLPMEYEILTKSASETDAGQTRR
jgi:CheY-like chemotaxis protein